MEGYFIGIDCGTQGTKGLLLDAGSGRIVAEGHRGHGIIEDAAGKREQDPAEWVDASREVIREVLSGSGTEGREVLGIGVSGQQHGFVPLDAEGNVIRPAKLWCDTSTQEQCDTLIERLGGLSRVIDLVGNGIPPGFTASKVRWLKEKEPESYRRLHTVLLPHDYLNFWLTGERKAEPGDASGTAFFDVRRRGWSAEVLAAIDEEGGLEEKLPPLLGSEEICGRLRPEIARELGLSPDVIISSGGGDNMLAAIGTGNVRPGIVTASLGTSGTIYAYSETPVVDPSGDLAAFCDSTGGSLPLVCTMNVTVSSELVKGCFGLSNEDLEQVVRDVAPGADGLIVLPYFQGERTPNIPHGTGVFFGLSAATFTQGHIARAAMEGAVFGMRYGLGVLERCGIEPRQVRLTGGGARSPAWQQMVADIFGCEVLTLPLEEAAAFGAAIQAIWARESISWKTDIAALTERYVEGEGGVTISPDAGRAKRYASLYEIHLSLSRSLEGLFRDHRPLLEGP